MQYSYTSVACGLQCRTLYKLYDSCFHAVLQSQQWKFTPKESKHYALKVVLQANLDGGTGAVKNSPGKHKAFLSVFGQGICGEIKVRALD